MNLLVSGYGQAEDLYFDLSNASDLVPHNMHFHKLGFFGLADGYISWFRSYIFVFLVLSSYSSE
jgi:hypothetical protein